jgi:hypothetical protein
MEIALIKRKLKNQTVSSSNQQQLTAIKRQKAKTIERAQETKEKESGLTSR